MEQTDYSNYIVFNPEGKVKQLEFVKNTSSLGSTVVALRNNSYGVFIIHNEKRSKFSKLQKKIFKIDDSTLFSFSGITNDGLRMVSYLKDRSVNEQVLKERKIHPIHIFDDLAVDASIRTLANGRRIYGIEGLLMTNNNGIRLVIFEPKGSVKEVRGMSIGNRSQSCRTILEDEYMKFENMGIKEMIETGRKALKNAFPEDGVLNSENVEIWVIEKDHGIRQLETEKYFK